MSDDVSRRAAARPGPLAAAGPASRRHPSGSRAAGDGEGIDRRLALRWVGGAALVAALGACSKAAAAPVGPSLIPERIDTEPLSTKEARERLELGNGRFVQGLAQHPDQSLVRRKKLGEGQTPFASIISCADSRVPPELVFDQGLGDLFVVRSAGHVVDKAVLGTLQFGISELKTPLLVVLGHSLCGAITATVEAVQKKSPPTGTDLDTLVTALRPAVLDARASGADEETVVSAAVANNVDNVVEQLKGAKVIEGAIKAGRLRIVGAVYETETGEVAFA